jgi:hypothetical protein
MQSGNETGECARKMDGVRKGNEGERECEFDTKAHFKPSS